jgi:hypothetical protein
MKLTGENRSTVPVPLCPPQIPHGLTPGSNPGLRGGRPAANRLSRGTASSAELSVGPTAAVPTKTAITQLPQYFTFWVLEDVRIPNGKECVKSITPYNI